MKNTLNNVSADKARELMESAITKAFKEKTTPPNIAMAGAAGVGKSSIVHSMAKSIAMTMDVGVDDVVVIDLRLASLEPSDVLGIPFVDGGDMKFSTPSYFPENDGKYYILFLDEMNSANPATQTASYRLVLDRTINNGKKLPDTCAIIGAGNRKEDKTGAKDLLPAFANRFAMHLNVDSSGTLDHFIETNVDETIIGFLAYDSSFINKPHSGEAGFPTPRSWKEGVNNHLSTYTNDMDLTIAISGAVGSEASTAFMAHREYYKSLPNWTKIRAGDDSYEYNVPSGDKGLEYSLGTSIAIQFIDALRDDLEDDVANLCTVSEQLSDEILIIMFRTIKRDKSVLARIMKHKSLFEQFNRIKSYVVA